MIRQCRNILVAWVFLFTSTAFCNPFDLRFSVFLDNDANDVFPDSFSVFGAPETIPDTLNAAGLLQPPVPPAGKYVTISQYGIPNDYMRERIAYDPNGPDLVYTMILNGFSDTPGVLSGDCIIGLENPEALDNLPDDCLVYIRRFDNEGNFIASYDLTDPDNHSFQWPVSDVAGEFGQLDFLVMDRCAAADIIINDMINLYDYAALATNWEQSGAGITGDIFQDDKVDLKDFIILAEKWLCSCGE